MRNAESVFRIIVHASLTHSAGTVTATGLAHVCTANGDPPFNGDAGATAVGEAAGATGAMTAAAKI